VNKYVYIIVVLLVAAAVTFALRLAPFAIFSKFKMTPKMQRIAQLLPAAIIAVLVVYCLRDAFYASATELIITLASTAVVVVLHLWKKQTLLSIAGGTIVYMVALRIFM
jgi:branched-subunit amino acid transport protein AzlD